MRKEIEEALEYLRNNPYVEYIYGQAYDQRVYNVLGSLWLDMDYQHNYRDINEDKLDELTLEQIATYYTFILRSERFADGSIASYINDGTLLRLVKRQAELEEE